MLTNPASLVLILTVVFPLRGAEPTIRPGGSEPWESPPPSRSHEKANLEMLRVFFAKDGDAVFKAYQVTWKGEEVIVNDSLAKSDYHAGETIPVLAARLDFANGTGTNVLQFWTHPRTLEIENNARSVQPPTTRPRRLENPTPTASSLNPVQLDVLGIFSAEDGGAIYRAYLVKWKEQVVVATDILSPSDYHVGDSIPVLAMNHRTSNDSRSLVFVVAPEPLKRPAKGTKNAWE